MQTVYTVDRFSREMTQEVYAVMIGKVPRDELSTLKCKKPIRIK